jgi:hypothetical protein
MRQQLVKRRRIAFVPAAPEKMLWPAKRQVLLQSQDI